MDPLPPRVASEFRQDIFDASLAVMLELWTILGAYQEAMVLVGGWAPYFILQEFGAADDGFRHVGSIDIDVALDPSSIDIQEYETIAKLIGVRGYVPRTDRSGHAIPFSFLREVESAGRYAIAVDFLGPEYGGTGKSRRHQRVQPDLLARKARGTEIAFVSSFTKVLAGTLPDGGTTSRSIRIADIVGSLTMKAMALGSRYKEKDAYDIYALIARFGDGPADVAARIKPSLNRGLVAEAVTIIDKAFASITETGPTWVADFLEPPGDARGRVMADAYAQVRRFLDAL